MFIILYFLISSLILNYFFPGNAPGAIVLNVILISIGGMQSVYLSKFQSCVYDHDDDIGFFDYFFIVIIFFLLAFVNYTTRELGNSILAWRFIGACFFFCLGNFVLYQLLVSLFVSEEDKKRIRQLNGRQKTAFQSSETEKQARRIEKEIEISGRIKLNQFVFRRFAWDNFD